jgi:hypothetical protein
VRLQALEATVALHFRKAVGADREGELPTGRRRHRGAQIIGEGLAAVALRSRQFLGLVDADENRRTAASGGIAQPSPLRFQRRLQDPMAGRRQAVGGPRGLAPGLAQTVANDAMCFDLAEIRACARQRLGEAEQRIGARTERPRGSQAGASRRRRGMMPALRSDDLPAPDAPKITNGRRSPLARICRSASSASAISRLRP